MQSSSYVVAVVSSVPFRAMMDEQETQLCYDSIASSTTELAVVFRTPPHDSPPLPKDGKLVSVTSGCIQLRCDLDRSPGKTACLLFAFSHKL